jgi:hypothetical protein
LRGNIIAARCWPAHLHGCRLSTTQKDVKKGCFELVVVSGAAVESLERTNLDRPSTKRGGF